MKYQEIKDKKQHKVDALFTECKVFFAFSNEQFQENKTPLEEGEKYVRIFGGGFIPQFQVKKFNKGLEDIEAWGKNEIKKQKQEKEQILYELSNYECWYTGDIENALPALNNYTPAQVQKVFNENYKKMTTNL